MNRRIPFALCSFLCLFMISFINSTHGVFLTPIIDAYGLKDSAQGLTSAAQNIGGLLALISSMWLLGRVTKPKLLVMGTILLIVVLVPMGFAPPFPALLGLTVVMGLSVGYLDTLSSASIADLYRGGEAARMMSILHAIFGIGGILAPILMRKLLGAGMQWNGIYLLLAGIVVAMLAYIAPTSVRWNKLAAQSPTKDQRPTLEGISGFFRDRTRLCLLGALICYAASLCVISIWLDRFVDIGLSGGELGAIGLSLFWFGVTACRLLTSVIRIAPVKYIRWGLLLAGVVLLPGILIGNAVVMVVAVSISGLISGSTIPMILHLNSEQYPGNTAMATNIMFFFVYSAQVICPPLLGMIEARFGMAAVMLVAPILSIIGGGFAFFARMPE